MWITTRGTVMVLGTGADTALGCWCGQLARAVSWLQRCENSAERSASGLCGQWRGHGARGWHGNSAGNWLATVADNDAAARWPIVAFMRTLRADTWLWLLAGHRLVTVARERRWERIATFWF